MIQLDRGRHERRNVAAIMTIDDRVLIAGAGPVGLVAAANLVRKGVPVAVFEAGPELSRESRASTFHPPTLDMLAEIGAADALLAQGLIAPRFQYRTKRDGVLAQFDFGAIADVTRHPYRVQCEQFRLTRILYDQLRGRPEFSIVFDAPVVSVRQDEMGVEIAVGREGSIDRRAGRWLIGADGARSAVRRTLGIEFEGFTWPERFLVVSTPFDFSKVIPDLAPVSYVADPQRWQFLLQIPGFCRVMFPRTAGRKRSDGGKPRLRRIADVDGCVRRFALRSRARHALQGSPARGEDVSAWSGSPGGRRRPYQQSAGWHGDERGHPRRDEPDNAAR